MSITDKQTFVAGAAGMTGTAIIKDLLAFNPNAVIRGSIFQTEPEVHSDRIEYVKADLRNLEDCRTVLKGCGCAILAAACTGGAGYTTGSPFEHMRENLVMNRQMLEACYLEEVERIVFIGSAVIYQPFEGSITEDELDLNKDPHMAYFGFAQAMRFLEKMCGFMHHQYGHQVIMVRAANIFGPRDKFHVSRSNFIPAIIRKSVDKMEPFQLWGRADVTRDVVFSDDFARAIVKLLDCKEIVCDAFNVGSGIRTTVGDVATWAMKAAAHRPKQIVWMQDKPQTIPFRALDVTKLKKVIGWEPRHSIQEGIRLTTRWWQENKESWKR